MKIILNKKQFKLLTESGGSIGKAGKIGNFDIPSYNKISDFVSWMDSNRTKFISALSDVTTDAQRKFNAMESLFKLAESGDIRAGELINGVPVEQYITRQGGLRDEFKRLTNPEIDIPQSKTLGNLDRFRDEISKVRTIEDYINKVKENFPMTSDEASSFIRDYVQKGGNPNSDFNKLGIGYANMDDIKVATFLKNKDSIPPLPVGEYLYHGTDNIALENIRKTGWLENLLGTENNPGGALAQKEKRTTATGDISTASTYAATTSQKNKSQPVLLRFDNDTKEKLNYFSTHPRKSSNEIEYSVDNGKTWQRITTDENYIK